MSPLERLLTVLSGEFNRLGTMEDRGRFVAEGKHALSLGTVRRSNWDDAQSSSRLYARLLHCVRPDG